VNEKTPTLVLLHGMGANAQIWEPLMAASDWPGRVIAPDFRGHGAAEWRNRYTLGSLASDVIDLLDHNESYIVLGHSMGGGVGLALGSGFFGNPPLGLAVLGLKILWSEEDLNRIPKMASKPPKIFQTRTEAIDWFLKLSGLIGIIEPTSSLIDRGIRQIEEGWMVSQDPSSFLAAPRHFLESLGSITKMGIPMTMALGSADPVATVEDHKLLPIEPPVVFEGLGHNPMVEDPHLVWNWFLKFASNLS
jgi:pimeloyl-ACP methyl ester carboxylesterase|tara:strand:+ start:738 stop:1481 length:744 start_codon:yes stop_codon:yes gene_type:complete